MNLSSTISRLENITHVLANNITNRAIITTNPHLIRQMPAISITESPNQPASTIATSTSAPDPVHAEFDGATFSLMRLPPEIRLEIYRHYFSDFHGSKRSTRTIWSKKSLSLLQTSSQVRREAAPIFYEECIGNQTFDKAHSWVLITSDPLHWVSRLKAMSKMLAQQNPQAEVVIRLLHGISSPNRPHLKTDTVLKGLRLANTICDYLRLLESSDRRLTHTEAKGGQPQPVGFAATIGDFVVAYSYSPTRKEERLSLRGPLARFDWSGLEP